MVPCTLGFLKFGIFAYPGMKSFLSQVQGNPVIYGYFFSRNFKFRKIINKIANEIIKNHDKYFVIYIII